jgi:hypothetical protein
LESVNNFMLEKSNVIRTQLANSKEVFGLSKDSFNLKLDTLKNAIKEKAKSIVNKEIAALENLRVDYLLKSLKAEYPAYNAYLHSVELDPNSVDYSFLDGLDMNNGYHLMFNEYSDLLNVQIMNKFKKEMGKIKIDSLPAVERLTKMFASIDNNVTNVEVRDYLKQNSFMDDLSYGEFWKMTDM